MGKRRTHEEFIDKLKEINPKIIPLESYINNSTKIKCKCTIHNEFCESTPKRLLQGRNCCKKCISEERSKRFLKSNEQFLQDMKDKNITDVIPLEEYKGDSTRILFRCSCGNLWYTMPKRVLLGNHCKKCGYDKFTGENNHFYNPNLSEEDRINSIYRFRNPSYKDFVQNCFKRDDYTCQITGKKSSGDIVVHHINGYNWDKENRTNINNGITLNKEIHKEFHKLYGKGNNTKEQFNQFIEILFNQERISIDRCNNIKERLKNIK